MTSAADVRAAIDRHGRVAVAMVLEARGSAPRDAGAVMIVHGGGIEGTIGGGAVEHRVVARAHELLSSDAPAHDVIGFSLGPDLDQCCGGSVRVALGVLEAGGRPDTPVELWPGGPRISDPEPKRCVHIYGAGHVGAALVAALMPLPYRITWVDPREGYLVAQPGVELVETPLPEAIASIAPPDAMHVVMTHSHAVDLEVVATILSRDFAFCGLIGSSTKRAVFENRLRERDVDSDAIARLVCPIGLPGLRDKRPEVIAASVAAQMLLVDAALRSEATESAAR